MATDLLLYEGDLAIQPIDLEEDISNRNVRSNQVLDLVEDDPNRASYKLLARVLKTPITYIKAWIIDLYGSRIKDLPYGNAIYLELSEPVTYDWLSRGNNHIKRALSNAPNDVKINSVRLALTGPSSVDIYIHYSISGLTYEVSTIVNFDDINNLTPT